ncbi:virulence plasmid A protein [Pseudomonas sp. SJZ080]|uniref:Tc toxin subunit A n=1 Tax=Pseudomonas sp. SJZ080 TaxID=2572888 RepID=UPI00119B66E3|nr:Tc toxin subunit A [Pseudomonas sp. SJZ080]TWC55258.1 virulence plasmid A protein [Pseudomonas sp. SJZ080]
MTVKKSSLMNALVERDMSPKKGRVDFETAMQKLGIESVFDIMRLSPSEFALRLRSHSDADPDLAYKNATRYAALVGRLYREYKTSSTNMQQLAQHAGIRSMTGEGATWQREFKEDWDSFVKVGAMAAIDSPVAYLAALWAFIHRLEATHDDDEALNTSIDPTRILLAERRPDMQELLISRESTFTPRPMLQIVTDVLADNLHEYLKVDPADKDKTIYQVLSERHFPFVLPYNFYHHQCQLGLSGNKPRLGELNYRASKLLPIGQAADNQYGAVGNAVLQTQQLLSGLSPEQQKLLTTASLPSGDIKLTRHDLIHGWEGIKSKHLPSPAIQPYCYVIPQSQADVGTPTPQANIPTAFHATENVVPVTFRKGDQIKIVNLAFSSLNFDGSNYQLVNRTRGGAATPFVLKVIAHEELPEIEEGYTATFNVLTVAGPVENPQELERHTFELTLGEQSTTPGWTTPDLDDLMHRSDLHAEQVEQLLARQRYSVRLSPNCQYPPHAADRGLSPE